MEVLEALPEWFEIPESRVSYAKESRELPFFADVDNDVARGFIVMKETSIIRWKSVLWVSGKNITVWGLAVNFLKHNSRGSRAVKCLRLLP